MAVGREPQKASEKPDLPGGRGDATVVLEGEVYTALAEVKERVLDRYRPDPGDEDAAVVSLALTVLQRAIGKSIVITDPATGRSDRSLTAAVLWKPE